MQYSEKVITAFALYSKTSDLIKETGLSRSSVVRYKRDKELQRLASERRLQAVRQSLHKMQFELTKSVEVLTEIRDNEKTAPQVRVLACNSLLNQCKDWTLSVDVLERLEALERAQNGSEWHSEKEVTLYD